ncbi:Methyltransferase domain containing protein [Candidatus Nanopelagicaceae bacterium]
MQLSRLTKFSLNIELHKSQGLEIGPLAKPIIRKEMGPIFYIDHASQQDLKEKYKNDTNTDVNEIVPVDFVQTTGSLIETLGDRKFDYVIASHVAEHVPDLVSWLQELSAVLQEDGVIRLAIPDKRYTFDFLRQLSDISDVLAAYIEKRKVSQPQRIIDFHLNYRVVDRVDAWVNPIDPVKLRSSANPDLIEIMNVAEEALHGTYHDIHNWVVTQNTFAILMQQLSMLNLISLGLEWFIPVEKHDNEFFVSLKSMHQKIAIESWEPMIKY